MAKIELARGVLEDFERFFDHLAHFDVQEAPARIDALQVLTHSPLIGQKVREGKRELVIGQGSRGYVALYRFVSDIDTVFVLAIRHQREAGYRSSNFQAA